MENHWIAPLMVIILQVQNHNFILIPPESQLFCDVFNQIEVG